LPVMALYFLFTLSVMDYTPIRARAFGTDFDKFFVRHFLLPLGLPCAPIASGEMVPVNHHLVVAANHGAPALLKPILQAYELLPVWEMIPQMQYVSNPEKRTINHLLSHMHRRLSVKQLSDGTIMLSGGWTVERAENGQTSGMLSATGLNLQDSISTFPFLERSEFLKADSSRIETSAIDGIPIIGRPVAVDNLTYALGSSGHGFAISLGISLLIANWIMHGTASPLLAPFSPARFHPATVE
jgi:sarcosine oxidase subunit beta